MADVVVAGAAGRMGSRLVALLREETELHLVAALEAAGHAALGRDAGEQAGVGRVAVPITADAEAVLGQDRTLIEFSVPEASLAHVRLVARQGARAVIGTTGFTPAQRDELAELGRRAPILVSPNMSVDVEIVETHHRFKKDAPSGTALRMAEVVAQALGRDLAKTAVYDRHDRLAERTRKEIGMAALRSGDVVGEHTVSFASLGERLELTHRAHSRDNFARGALRAARFIAGAKPGLYSMQDVLGLT
jgi:4-hydroxy-tetrahydrodipicolinate reductase